MLRVTSWMAQSNGALDLRGHDLESEGFDLVVTPTVPGTPLFLFGEGAALWRRIAESATDADDLEPHERTLVHEFVDAGIAAESAGSSTAEQPVERPWLSSVFHELVYALVARVAAEQGIDVMFIKGPTLHAQGLREREHSGDVDCLVLPGEDLALARAMEEWGWRSVVTPLTGTGVSHSLTLSAPDWGCAIDVHTRFPGIALEPAAAFDLIRRRGEDRRFAGTTVRTPSRAEHAVIAALHSVRPYLGTPPGEALIQAAADSLHAGGADVVERVVELRAGYALGEPLERAFPAVRIPAAAAVAPFDWKWRSTPQGPRRHLMALALVPWRMRVRTFIRLVWPARDSAGTPAPGETSTARRSRMRRIIDAVADLLGRRDA